MQNNAFGILHADCEKSSPVSVVLEETESVHRGISHEHLAKVDGIFLICRNLSGKYSIIQENTQKISLSGGEIVA